MLMDPRNPAAGGTPECHPLGDPLPDPDRFLGLEEIDPVEFEGLVAGGEMEGGGNQVRHLPSSPPIFARFSPIFPPPGFMGLEEIDPAEFEGLVAGGEMEGGWDQAGGAMEGGDLEGGEMEGGGESGEEGAGEEPGDGDVEADGGESGTGLGDGGVGDRVLEEGSTEEVEGKGKMSKSKRRKLQRKQLKKALKGGGRGEKGKGAGGKREEGKEEGEEEGDEKEREEGEEREDGEDKEEGEEGEEEEGEEGEEDGESDGEGTGGEAVEEREGAEGEGEEREEDIDMPEWDRLRLHPLILRALNDLGFTSPTPIQRACIPAAASRGRDVVGAAETGSGKTLAFAIPILQRLLDEREKERRLKDGGGAWGEEGEGEGADGGEVGEAEGNEGAGSDRVGEEQSGEGEGGGEGGGEGEGEGVGKTGGKAAGGGVRKRVRGPLRALIITPTRELALQIVSHIKDAARHTGIHVAGIVGGMAEVKQKRVLSLGPQIVVGTPGRLWELMSQGEAHLVQLEHLSFLVLDEADRMADPGRFKELSSILGMLPPTAASLAAANAKEAALAARDAARAAKKAARAAKIAEERDAARGKKGKGKAGMENAEKEGKGEEEAVEKEEKEEEIKAERGGEEGEEGKEDGEEGEVGEEGESGEGEGGGEEVFSLQPPTLAKKKRQVLVFSATLVLPDDTRGQLQGKKRTPGGPGAADRRTGRKREREGAQGGEEGGEDEGEKEREKGLERDRVVAALMELTGMRPSPAIVDLTTADVVASGVQEAVLECDDSMRDVFLLYLLRMHGTFGRTLVFCSAISSVRRLASLLSLLQVPSFPLLLHRIHAQQQQLQRLKALDRFKQHVLLPAPLLLNLFGLSSYLHPRSCPLSPSAQVPSFPLHAQQQQRQRLKALDRFKQHPSGVLVATDVAARGLDVPESGPLPTFPVDHNYLPNLKQCVSLALSVDTLSRKHSKEKAETSWKQRASKAVQVNLEERGADVAGGEEEDEDEEGGGEESEEDFDDFDEAGGESDDEGERGGRGKRNKKQQQREEEERRSKRRWGGARGREEEEEGDVDRGVDVRRLVGRGEKRGWEGPGETGEDGRQQMKQETIELQRMKEALKQAVSQPLRPTNLRSLISASGMTTELANQLRATPSAAATSSAAAGTQRLANPFVSLATARAGKQWGTVQGGGER
ncbi:unnamed protein product, partial [Closterium sp. NIES-54]